jgi:hypothetical protein
MAERQARFGAYRYAVRVSQMVAPQGEVDFDADSLAITPAGALVLAVEVPPFEDEPGEPPSGIEVPPYVVFAPGQWFSAVMIHEETRRPYVEWLKSLADDDDDDEGDIG